MFVSVWQSPVVRQYAVVIIVNLSVLSVGLGIAWSSPVLVKLRNETQPVLGRPVSEDEGSWIVSVSFICGFIVNILGVYLVDKIGRKYCFILAAVPRIISYIILSFAREVWMILVARLLGGLADGLTFIVVPMYASEVASNDVRGGLGTMLQIFASLGIVTMLCMGPFLDYFTLNIIVLAISVITAVPLLFLPDSPYFLHRIGRKEDAMKVLTYLRCSETVAKDEILEYETQTIETITVTEVFQSKTILKALGIVIVIGAGSQMTGFNAVSFYLQTIFESTKTSVSPEIGSVIIGIIQLSSSVCTTLIIDKFGRKPIIGVSLVGLALGLIGLGTFFKLTESGYRVVGFLNFLPLASLVLVVWCFSGGLGSLIWPLTSELFDGRARGIGVSTSLFFNVLFLFITTKFFASVTSTFGPPATYYFFSVCTGLLLVFILFCVPETKGKSFTEIQAALGGKSDSTDSLDKS